MKYGVIHKIEDLLNRVGKSEDLILVKRGIQSLLGENPWLVTILTKKSSTPFEKQLIIDDLISNNNVKETLLFILQELENDKNDS